MRKDTRIRFRINSETKDEWEEYAKNEYQGNLSSMIKDAVDRLRSDEWVRTSEIRQSEPVDVDLEGVDTELDQIKSEISALRDQMDAVSAPDDSEERLDEMERMRLANRIRDVLPEVPNEWTMREVMKSEAMLEKHEKVKISGAVNDLAGYLEEPRHHIWEAAVELENKDDHVESFIDNGTRRWFVHNPRVDIPEGIDEDEIPNDVDFEKGSEFR